MHRISNAAFFRLYEGPLLGLANGQQVLAKVQVEILSPVKFDGRLVAALALDNAASRMRGELRNDL